MKQFFIFERLLIVGLLFYFSRGRMLLKGLKNLPFKMVDSLMIFTLMMKAILS